MTEKDCSSVPLDSGLAPIFSRIAHEQVRSIGVLRYRKNARTHSKEQVKLLVKAIMRFGWTTPVLIDENDVVLAGYGRLEAARELGWEKVPVMVAVGWTETEKKAYMLADNQIALKAGWDEELLKIELDELKLMDFEMDLIGFDEKELKSMSETGHLERPVVSLRERFGLPPFSILDGRSGWWQDRKRAWLAIGIESELGRGDNALRFSDTILQPDPNKRRSQKLSRNVAEVSA